jgi:hypothetical protein
MLSYLRSHLSYANVMATVAVFIALGGTSYGLATGAIGSREIKDNTIRSKDVRNNEIRSRDVRDRSLLAKDFKAGQLPAGPAGRAGPAGAEGPQGPPGPTFAGFKDDDDPVASPDFLTTGAHGQATITAPASGRLLAIFSSAAGVSVNCSSGNGTLGLYVDGVAVPNTQRNFTSGSFTGADVILGVTANGLPAGGHTIQLGLDCTTGNFVGASLTTNTDLGGVLLSG